jgi:hypothetical protein
MFHAPEDRRRRGVYNLIIGKPTEGEQSTKWTRREGVRGSVGV